LIFSIGLIVGATLMAILAANRVSDLERQLYKKKEGNIDV
jgi:hypothetical protein